MLLASLFENVGGVKTIVLIVLALIIAVYLRFLSRREKPETATERLTAERLNATPDDQLLNTVVRRLLADCDPAHPDPYRQTAVWTNAQVNVYSVWVAVKELGATGFATLQTSPSGRFLPLAADGFAQLGALRCEAAVREWLSVESPNEAVCAAADEAFSAAVAAENPLALCVPYIRDNADAFVTDAS